MPPSPLTASALCQRLIELPFDAFTALIARLLPPLGYRHVRLAGRRDFKGRNGRDGASGYDLTATRDGRTVLVQLKQFGTEHPLFQRSLDELRGVCLRSSAAEALLITTGSISPSVERERHRLAPIAPVATMDGEELTALLVRYRIGVTRNGEVDEAMLSKLTSEATGNRPGDCTGPQFIVTVGIERAVRKAPSPAR